MKNILPHLYVCFVYALATIGGWLLTRAGLFFLESPIPMILWHCLKDTLFYTGIFMVVCLYVYIAYHVIRLIITEGF